MYCTKCGSFLDENDKFCKYCGTQIPDYQSGDYNNSFVRNPNENISYDTKRIPNAFMTVDYNPENPSIKGIGEGSRTQIADIEWRTEQGSPNSSMGWGVTGGSPNSSMGWEAAGGSPNSSTEWGATGGSPNPGTEKGTDNWNTSYDSRVGNNNEECFFSFGSSIGMQYLRFRRKYEALILDNQFTVNEYEQQIDRIKEIRYGFHFAWIYMISSLIAILFFIFDKEPPMEPRMGMLSVLGVLFLIGANLRIDIVNDDGEYISIYNWFGFTGRKILRTLKNNSNFRAAMNYRFFQIIPKIIMICLIVFGFFYVTLGDSEGWIASVAPSTQSHVENKKPIEKPIVEKPIEKPIVEKPMEKPEEKPTETLDIEQTDYPYIEGFIATICSYSDPPFFENEDQERTYFQALYDEWENGESFTYLKVDANGDFYFDLSKEYLGYWVNEWSERCQMEIKQNQNSDYQIDVWWSGSYNTSSHWEFIGKYNPQTLAIDYEGACYGEYYGDDGKLEKKELEYRTSGMLVLEDFSCLRWYDAMEDEMDMKFQKSQTNSQ